MRPKNKSRVRKKERESIVNSSACDPLFSLSESMYIYFFRLTLPRLLLFLCVLRLVSKKRCCVSQQPFAFLFTSLLFSYTHMQLSSCYDLHVTSLLLSLSLFPCLSFSFLPFVLHPIRCYTSISRGSVENRKRERKRSEKTTL